jgi:HEAT repeat protein
MDPGEAWKAVRSASARDRARAVEALAAQEAWADLAVALDDPALDVRLAAARALGRAPDAAPLARAANHPDLRVRGEAVRALAARRDAPRLLALLRESRHPDVRRDALDALAPTGPEAVILGLADASPLVRLVAVRHLAGAAPRAALPSLLRALDDADRDVQRAARAGLDSLHPDLDALLDAVAHATSAAAVEWIRRRLDAATVDDLFRRLWAVPPADAELLRAIAWRDGAALHPVLRGVDDGRALAALEAIFAADVPLDALAADWAWNAAVRRRLAERAAGTQAPWADTCLLRAAEEDERALRAALARGLAPKVAPGTAARILGSAEWPDAQRARVARHAPAGALERALADRAPAVRRAAAETLARTRALDPLARAAETDDLVVLRHVAITLGEAGDPRAALPLVRAAEEGRGDLNRRAKKLLAGRAFAVPELLEWAARPRASIRRFAVEKLGESGDERALEALLRAVDDAHVDVQYAAVLALQGFAGREAVADRLIACLGYGDVGVRQAAVEALGEARVAKAVPALTKALGNPFLKARAAEALKRIGDRQGMLAVLRRKRREETIDRERRRIRDRTRRKR